MSVQTGGTRHVSAVVKASISAGIIAQHMYVMR